MDFLDHTGRDCPWGYWTSSYYSTHTHYHHRHHYCCLSANRFHTVDYSWNCHHHDYHNRSSLPSHCYRPAAVVAAAAVAVGPAALPSLVVELVAAEPPS